MGIKKERRYWYGMLLKYVCWSQKCDYAFVCQKLFISSADPIVLLNKLIGFFQNTGIIINLLWSVLKIDKII